MESWQNGQLVGGLYGLSLGRSFFGESMFSLTSNASSIALITLVKHLNTAGFHLVDCQVTTDHLMRFGAREIPRDRFLDELKRSLQYQTLKGQWQLAPDGGIRVRPLCESLRSAAPLPLDNEWIGR